MSPAVNVLVVFQANALWENLGVKADMMFRRSKLRPSIDHLAIVCLLLAQLAFDWRSLCCQTKLLQSQEVSELITMAK